MVQRGHRDPRSDASTSAASTHTPHHHRRRRHRRRWGWGWRGRRCACGPLADRILPKRPLLRGRTGRRQPAAPDPPRVERRRAGDGVRDLRKRPMAHQVALRRHFGRPRRRGKDHPVCGRVRPGGGLVHRLRTRKRPQDRELAPAHTRDPDGTAPRICPRARLCRRADRDRHTRLHLAAHRPRKCGVRRSGHRGTEAGCRLASPRRRATRSASC